MPLSKQRGNWKSRKESSEEGGGGRMRESGKKRKQDEYKGKTKQNRPKLDKNCANVG